MFGKNKRIIQAFQGNVELKKIILGEEIIWPLTSEFTEAYVESWGNLFKLDYLRNLDNPNAHSTNVALDPSYGSHIFDLVKNENLDTLYLGGNSTRRIWLVNAETLERTSQTNQFSGHIFGVDFDEEYIYVVEGTTLRKLEKNWPHSIIGSTSFQASSMVRRKHLIIGTHNGVLRFCNKETLSVSSHTFHRPGGANWPNHTPWLYKTEDDGVVVVWHHPASTSNPKIGFRKLSFDANDEVTDFTQWNTLDGFEHDFSSPSGYISHAFPTWDGEKLIVFTAPDRFLNSDPQYVHEFSLSDGTLLRSVQQNTYDDVSWGNPVKVGVAYRGVRTRDAYYSLTGVSGNTKLGVINLDTLEVSFLDTNIIAAYNQVEMFNGNKSHGRRFD